MNKIVLVAVLTCICAVPRHAVSYVIQDLGTLGGANSYAYGVNQLGQVVGVSDAADGTQHAFVWQNGVMTDLGVGQACGINDSGQVVGFSGTVSAGVHAVIWQNGAATDLTPLVGDDSYAVGVGNEGQIAGHFQHEPVQFRLGSARQHSHLFRQDGRCKHRCLGHKLSGLGDRIHDYGK